MKKQFSWLSSYLIVGVNNKPCKVTIVSSTGSFWDKKTQRSRQSLALPYAGR